MAAQGITPPSTFEVVRGTVGALNRGALLGPGTMTFNLASALMQPLWAGPKEPTRAVVRAVSTGNPEALREAGAAASGALVGLGHVGEALWDLLRARGKYAPSPEHADLSQRLADPIGRGLLQALDTPGRIWAGAPDAVAGTIAQYAVESRRAAQLATDAGHRGDKWKEWYGLYLSEAERARTTGAPAHQIGAGTADVIAAGDAAAERAGYRQPLGTVGRAARKVARLGDAPIVGDLVAPFFNGPWNIHLQALERTPVGLAMNTQPAKFDRYYDALVGSAATIGLAEMVREGKVTITGSGPTDKNERQAWLDQGNKPYSLTVGPVAIPNRAFAGAEPLLNAVGDTFDALRYQKPDDDARTISEDALARIGQQIRQYPYSAGYATIANVVQYGLPSLGADLATRATPGAATLRAIGTSQDAAERTVDRGARVPMGQEALERWQQATGQRSGLPVAQNILGEPKENTQRGPAAFVGRFGYPKEDPVISLFQEAGVYPPDPRDKISLNDTISIALTPDETRRWDAARGAVLREAGQELLADPEWTSLPPDRKEKILKGIFAHAAKAADGQVLEQIGDDEINRRVEAAPPKAS
jgi:hypothetical protein